MAGVSYDPNVDYQDLIEKAEAQGDYAAAAQYEQQRNQKIADMNAAGGGTNQYGATPSYKYTSNFSGTAYNPDTDYKDLMNKAHDDGRYTDAAYYEQLRNQKLADLEAAGNTQWGPQTNQYSQYLGNGYTSLNSYINGNSDLHYEEVDKLKEFLQQNPSAAAQLSQEDLQNLAVKYGIDPSLFNSFSQRGGYTQNLNTAIAGGGTGQPVENFYEEGVWYYYPGVDREVKEGTSGADERFLSDGAYSLIQALSDEWFRLDALATAAKNAGNTELYNQYISDRNQCNVTANQIRNLAGYSGGVDGSMYIPNGQLGIDDSQYPYRGGVVNTTTKVPSNGGSATIPSGGTTGGAQLPSGDTSGGSGNVSNLGNLGGLGNVTIDPLQKQNFDELKAMLDSWQNAAMSQQNGQIDYSVQQAIAQLQRALEDSQPQYKTMSESVTRDEMQALDNSALYAELRGDKGGIGQAQYNSIQNAAAQNRLSVQQAQTKLATDTERQIADLRAQGEFQKADAALEITQQYLTQLMSLQQWAEEYNLSVDQFNTQLKQWEAEYQMALKQLSIDTDLAYGQLTGTIPSTGQNTLAMNQFLEQMREWEKEFALAQDQFKVDTDLAYGQLTGIVPSTGQNTLAQNQYLSGLDQWKQEFQFAQQQHQDALNQWQQEFNAAQNSQSSGSGGSDSSGSSGSGSTTMDYEGLFEAAQASGHPQSFIANNYKKYGFTSSSGLYNDYKVWAEEASNSEPTLQDLDIGSVLDLNMGSISYDEVELMVQYGALEMVDSGDKIGVRWANGWNAAKWREFKSRLSSPGGLLGFPGLT